MTPEQKAILADAVAWAEQEAKKSLEERKWNQLDWKSDGDCGTTYCIAGYIGLTGGFRFTHSGGWGTDPETGKHGHVVDYATRLLGLSGIPTLFASSNTAANLREIAEEMAGGPL